MSVPDRAAFVAALGTERAGYEALCEILRAEQAGLERGDVDAVQALTERKSRQVEELTALARDRAAFLGASRLAPDPSGMETWLQTHGGAQREVLAKTWERLLACAAEARRLNEVNGALLALRLGHAQAAFATLQAAARQHSVYGPDGQNELRPANRNLGSA
jgi:flagella synthesis protein FlgN